MAWEARQQRYYDPLLGRFLSVDPVTTNAATGDSFNRYVYARNNPYRYTDPDGRNPWGAVVGGGLELISQGIQGKWSGPLTGTAVMNNLKDVGIAALGGAITGGVGGAAAGKALAGAISTGAAALQTAAAWMLMGGVSAVASDGLEIGGKGITLETGLKAGIGAATGALGGAAGGALGSKVASNFNSLASKGGVANHVASTTAGAVSGSTTGVTTGAVAGAAGAGLAIDAANVAATKAGESLVQK